MCGGVQCGECDSAREILVNVDMCIYLSIAVFVSLSLSLSLCLPWYTITSINSCRQRQRKWTEQQYHGQHDATSAQIGRRFRVDYTAALSTLVYYHTYKLKQTTSKDMNGTTASRPTWWNQRSNKASFSRWLRGCTFHFQLKMATVKCFISPWPFSDG